MGVIYVFLIQTNPAWIEIGIVFVHEQYIRGQYIRGQYIRGQTMVSFFKTNEKKLNDLTLFEQS